MNRCFPLSASAFTFALASRFSLGSRLAPALHRVRARMARCSTRGPCAAVRRGRQGRAAGESMDGLAFSRGQEPARKARHRLTDLPGRKPGKRQAGWPSLLVTFLLATQEKSDSGAAGARKLLTVCTQCNQRTSQRRHRDQSESRSRTASIVSAANFRIRPPPASANNSLNLAPASS
jgi:hypothetical protein